MAVTSMTGFARAEGRHGDQCWTWEVRSVNGRGLDVRCRLPAGYEGLEALTRGAAPKRFKRGSVTVTLQLARPDGETKLQINHAFLAQLVDLHRELDGQVDPAPPRLDILLGVRGVVESADSSAGAMEHAARQAALNESLTQALDGLAAARRQEGDRLHEFLDQHLDDIARLCGEARDVAALRPEAVKARLETQVAALISASPALPEERLAQEAALLAVKSDVCEEVERMGAHVATAREMLDDGDPIGRRLDFLCQEFNREANTLCAKSSDLELTGIGLALKAAIDQLREQVQNVE